jgi:pre-mRNA-splicing factor ATP-dependent RNA helicase DHX38/PRP16
MHKCVIIYTKQGQEDIEATCEVLAERMETLDGAPPLLLLPMYSQLPADLQVHTYSFVIINHITLTVLL